MPAIPDGDSSLEVEETALRLSRAGERLSQLPDHRKISAIGGRGSARAPSTIGGRISAMGGRKAKRVLSNIKDDADSVSRIMTTGMMRAELAPCWAKMSGLESQGPMLKEGSTFGVGRTITIHSSDEDAETKRMSELQHSRWLLLRCIQRRVLRPGSFRRFIWDVIGFVLIVWDIVTVPLQFFDMQQVAEVSWPSRLFWSIDIPVNFITGYLKEDGVSEVRLGRIFRRYARSWLVADMLIVAVDWADSLEGVSDFVTARLGKTVRAIRVLRIMRLVRIVRLSSISGTWLEQAVRSEKLMLVAGIAKVTLFLVMLIHFVTCMWYGVGCSGDDAGWVHVHWARGAMDEGMLHRYMTSFHWSLSQFAGTMEIYPDTFAERVFAVTVLLLAFLLSAIFISNITSAMTRLNIISGNEASMSATLTDYLRDRGISSRLTIRVQRNAKHALLMSRQRCDENDVELLQMISEPLRMEIHFELYAPVLRSHPLFRWLEGMAPPAVRRLCHAAIRTTFISHGDVLFTDFEAKDPPEMYFVTKGELGYKQFGMTISTSVGVGSWVAEPLLWCSWVHRGIAAARCESELLALDANGFRTIASNTSLPNVNLGLYAVEFVEAVTKRSLTDLDQGLALETVMSTMDVDETEMFQSTSSMQNVGHTLSGFRKGLARGYSNVSNFTSNTRISRPDGGWSNRMSTLSRSCTSLGPQELMPRSFTSQSVVGAAAPRLDGGQAQDVPPFPCAASAARPLPPLDGGVASSGSAQAGTPPGTPQAKLSLQGTFGSFDPAGYRLSLGVRSSAQAPSIQPPEDITQGRPSVSPPKSPSQATQGSASGSFRSPLSSGEAPGLAGLILPEEETCTTQEQVLD